MVSVFEHGVFLLLVASDRGAIGRFMNLRRDIAISISDSTHRQSQMVVVRLDLFLVLEVLEHFPAQVFVLKTVPLHTELLHEVAMLPVLRRKKQCFDVFVPLHLDVVHLHLRHDAHIQNPIHLGEVRVEIDVSSVCGEVEKEVWLVPEKALELRRDTTQTIIFCFIREPSNSIKLDSVSHEQCR